jgi:predicted AlkP superfamily phosphohydrolase/phosphomutase
MKKAIVIGLDGLEPKVVDAMQARGEMPNMRKLQELGGYSRIRTTYPAQTPVAWSSFTTGTNPGGHGIYDYLNRDLKTYLPVLALTRYEQKNAFVLPKVVNLRRGTPFWNLLSAAGIPSTIIRCPCTYPPDEINGRMLSGVGVPDIRGGLGTSTFYTTRSGEHAEHSEKVIQVTIQDSGKISTHLIGPRDPRTRSDFTHDIQLQIDTRAGKVIVQSQGQPANLNVGLGQWSDWLKVKFKIGMLQSVRGMVRFFLNRLEPDFELYASPVNYDIDAPLFPISHPAEYAGELQARLGPYYTSGMAEDHDGLNNGRFDETAFLDQIQIVLDERKRMVLYELNRFTQGFFFTVFDTPDRLTHMFWRFREIDHPANKAGLPTGFMDAIQQHYRQLDEIIGLVMKAASPDTLIIVLSDHGMNSFQRGLNLNTWLCENGFLALKNGAKPGEENGDFFHNVDWSHSKAYALGLGTIYLNLRGRELQGILSPDEANQVKQAIVNGLTGLPDPERGHVAVRSVLTQEQLYSGPFVNEAPDLVVNFSEGYRVSWDTPLGGVPAGLFTDNTNKWGGDHVIDPSLVPGVLFMNKPFNQDAPSLVDMAPTILSYFNLPSGLKMEGRNLFT